MSVPGRDFRDVVLNVWREACRHIELTESLGSMARLLGQHMPLAALVVRELDGRRMSLHTVAVAPATPLVSAAGRSLASAVDYKRWLAWCRRGDVGHRRAGTLRRAEWASMIPGADERDALIGPLTNREGPLGVVVLIARRALPFTGDHAEMVRALLEPLATALENDRRVRELKGLGEAAAADRQTLPAQGRRAPGGDTIVGADTGLRLVMERVTEAARARTPVLILGEQGSGKEVVARAIHAASSRAAGPFIRVNCGAIPLERVEAELFGGDGGSTRDGPHGWVQRASGGTLFLDEIAALPLAAQGRLVEVLSTAPGDHTGADDSAQTDVRLVGATDQDLASLVRDGRFRQDLWYRLATFPMLLPPLRERTEDIPALARHLAQRAALRFGLPQRALSAEDLTLLMAYSWPGNVRELAAVIDRAVLLGRGDRLEVGAALGPVARGGEGSRGADRPAAAAAPGRLASLDEAMRQHIEAALALTEGRIEGEHGAARLLKINPHTLRSRMRKLGIEWTAFKSDR
jgi:DNA-binding NtrC family response regulator